MANTGVLAIPTQKWTTPTLVSSRSKKKAGDRSSTTQITSIPPSTPTTMATNTSSGIMNSMAANRGRISASNGSTPITCMASTSWFIFIAPSSAAKEDEDRPARMTAVISTANSRRTPTPISSTANTVAPNWRRRLAPRKARVAPTNRLVVATIGSASSPVRSISDTVEATRSRLGCRMTRNRVTSSRP